MAKLNLLTKIRGLFAVLFLSVIVLSSSQGQVPVAPGNSRVENPGEPIVSFDVENIGPILTELNFPWQLRTTPDGRFYILVTGPDQTILILSPLACRNYSSRPNGNLPPTGCVGLQIVSIFEGDSDPDLIQAFNNRYLFAHIGINEAGNAYLNRYDIADYGIARGNVATIISTFVDLAERYQTTVASQSRIVSGGQSARIRVAAVADAVNQFSLQSSQNNDRHSDLQKEAARHLDSLFRDLATARNKIINHTDSVTE